VQLAVLVFAAALLLSAFLLVTTGRPWLWDRWCVREEELVPYATPMDYLNAGLRAIVGLGLMLVALKDLRGPRLQDPMLIGLLLFYASVAILIGSTTTLVTGVARLGVRRCLELGPPWSYGYGAVFLAIGAVLLYAVAVMVLERGGDD
jgi:hypothetical protein